MQFKLSHNTPSFLLIPQTAAADPGYLSAVLTVLPRSVNRENRREHLPGRRGVPACNHIKNYMDLLYHTMKKASRAIEHLFAFQTSYRRFHRILRQRFRLVLQQFLQLVLPADPLTVLSTAFIPGTVFPSELFPAGTFFYTRPVFSCRSVLFQPAPPESTSRALSS